MFLAMAGRPKLLALRKRIAKDDLEDAIFEAVAEGIPIGKVCEKFQITSRKMFYDWKGKEGERHDKYQAARLIAAEAHAERAGEILDALDGKEILTGPEVQAATARSKYQQWLASVKNRDEFGSQDKGAVVNLNFTDLHFEALRNARPKAKKKITEAVEVIHEETDDVIPEAEFVEIGAGKDGEATAQTGHTPEPITPPAPSLAHPELEGLL